MSCARFLGKITVSMAILVASAVQAQSAGPDPDRYIVKFKSGPVPRAVLRGANAELRVDLPWMGWCRPIS